MLVLVICLVISCADPPSLADFLVQELRPYPNDFEEVDPDANYFDHLPKAMQAYERKEWDQAQIFLREHRKLFRAYQELDFFLANAYLGSGELERAESILADITGECQYYGQALWYRALLSASRKDLGEARKLLRGFQLVAEQYDFKVDEAALFDQLLSEQSKT